MCVALYAHKTRMLVADLSVGISILSVCNRIDTVGQTVCSTLTYVGVLFNRMDTVTYRQLSVCNCIDTVGQNFSAHLTVTRKLPLKSDPTQIVIGHYESPVIEDDIPSLKKSRSFCSSRKQGFSKALSKISVLLY